MVLQQEIGLKSPILNGFEILGMRVMIVALDSFLRVVTVAEQSLYKPLYNTIHVIARTLFPMLIY